MTRAFKDGKGGESTLLDGMIPALYARARRVTAGGVSAAVGASTLVGEVLLVYARRRAELRDWPARKRAAWLFTGLRFTLNNLRRKARPRIEPVDPDQLPAPNGSHGWEALEKAERLSQALPLLSQRERDVIRLRFAEGLSHREVAERLELSEAHVRVIQKRAIDRLKSLMKRAGV